MSALGYFIITVAALALLLASMGGASRQKSSHDSSEAAFHRIYGALSPMPKFKASWSYSYPAFEVIFGSKAEMEKAAHLNAEFGRELERHLQDAGPFDRRFRAGIGVSFTYPGYIEEMVASYRLKAPNQASEPTAPSGRGTS